MLTEYVDCSELTICLIAVWTVQNVLRFKNFNSTYIQLKISKVLQSARLVNM